jgi:GNAT superfamily N-acetyltransferase
VPDVRPFTRADRDGLTSLANRHIAAVLPGGAIPVASLLSQMERDTHEPIVDPWVIDRHTLVGVDRDRVVAAAHLKRYATEGSVNDAYRNFAEIVWLIFDPDAAATATALLASAMNHLRSWNAREWGADGNLPCLGVYGIPDAWPHVQQLLLDAGFSVDGEQIEVVFAGDLASVAEPGPAPVEGVTVRRVVGPLGTSFEAVLDGTVIGDFEVEDFYGTNNDALSPWADECNHRVDAAHRRNGIGSWLFQHGCAWLRLGGKERFLSYAVEQWGRAAVPIEGNLEGWTTYYERFGLRPITRTRRGWHRTPDGA